MGNGLLSSIKAAGLTGPEALKGIVRGLRPVTGYGDIDVSDADEGLNVGRGENVISVKNAGLARIVAAGPSGQADWTDERYWLAWQLAKESGPASRLSLAMAAVYDPAIVTGSNIDEMTDDGSAGTHILPVGTKVWVWIVEGAGGNAHYVFSRSLNPSVVVRVDANATGGGKYAGKILKPTSDAEATGDLAMPEGMAVGDDCLILHLPEDGLPTHWIKLNTTATGVVIGRTDEETPKWIVAIPNGTYRTASPLALVGSGATSSDEDGRSWARDAATAGDAYGDGPVTLTRERTEWDATTGELVKFVHEESYDAGGNLFSVSAETRVVIVAFGVCP